MRPLSNWILMLPFLSACQHSDAACSNRTLHDPIVERALQLYGKGRITPEQLRKTFEISVVYLPNMTCVGFNLKSGTLGGDETWCFDKSGRKILSYVNGD